MPLPFYGSVKGRGRSIARRGAKVTGIITTAASAQGACQVWLHRVAGEDRVEVVLMPWQGEGTHVVLYDGPVSGGGEVVAPTAPAWFSRDEGER